MLISHYQSPPKPSKQRMEEKEEKEEKESMDLLISQTLPPPPPSPSPPFSSPATLKSCSLLVNLTELGTQPRTVVVGCYQLRSVIISKHQLPSVTITISKYQLPSVTITISKYQLPSVTITISKYQLPSVTIRHDQRQTQERWPAWCHVVVGFYYIHPKAHKVGQPLCDSRRGRPLQPKSAGLPGITRQPAGLPLKIFRLNSLLLLLPCATRQPAGLPLKIFD
jgi:hypothetical protein